MGVAIIDSECQVRLLSFHVSPGHTEKEWMLFFDSIKSLVENASHVVCHCDGEEAIKTAFYKSKVLSLKTKQTCTRHAGWSDATKTGAENADNFHSTCANASCEEVRSGYVSHNNLGCAIT